MNPTPQIKVSGNIAREISALWLRGRAEMAMNDR
jgi:hypothetical protein